MDPGLYDSLIKDKKVSFIWTSKTNDLYYFDKTGALTEEKMKVNNVIAVNDKIFITNTSEDESKDNGKNKENDIETHFETTFMAQSHNKNIQMFLAMIIVCIITEHA